MLLGEQLLRNRHRQKEKLAMPEVRLRTQLNQQRTTD